MTTAAKQGKKSRILLVLGLVMVSVGIALLGWVGWQYWGTNTVSKRAHQQIAAEVIRDWEAGKTPVEGVGLLRIPRFGENYEVPILDGDDDPTLARGVGRYLEGGDPGQIGNLVLSGHRVTHGEPFRNFLELRAGDEVIVETKTHIYTYVLSQDGDETRVPFTTSWPLWPVPDPEAEGEKPTAAKVTLVTCAELFRTNDRNVVVGTLAKTVEKPNRTDP
ncbi:MAG TPA: sortase [Aeromicrobium sp.]|nr:sortase [Aeromicrobium sp.]